MKIKNIITVLAFALLPLSAFAWGVATISGGVAAPAGYDETACVGGFDDQTSCDYTTAPASSSAISSDGTRLRKWTATCNGQVSRVKIYCHSGVPPSGTVTAVVYNGTALIATGTLTPSATTWVWSGDLEVQSGHSLEFATGDVLYYGLSFDYSADNWSFGRDAESDTPSKNYYGVAVYLQDPLEVPAVSNYQMGAILEYLY